MQTSIFSSERIQIRSLWTCTAPGDISTLFSHSFGNLSLSLTLCFSVHVPVSEHGKVLAPVLPTLHCPNSNHRPAYFQQSLLNRTVGKPCSLVLGGALSVISSLLQDLQWTPGGWRCVESPVVQWSSRPSMTTATAEQTDGRFAYGKVNALFSWRRRTLIGGRWEKKVYFLCLLLHLTHKYHENENMYK